MAESKWKALKDIEDNYENAKTALTQLFEFVINNAYHTEARGVGQRKFGSLTPKQSMDNMMTLYGKPSLPELETLLQRLLEPMDCSKPIEVMLRDIEGVQLIYSRIQRKKGNCRISV